MVTDTFGLVQEGVDWFGPENVTISVTVHPRAAPPDSDGGVDLPPTATADPPPTADPVVVGTVGDGTITGGCAAVGPPGPVSWAWLVAVPLLLLTRRRRRTMP
jgi:uncharacterized protein (TIGR03382 family)